MKNIDLTLCGNPLPPINEAIDAANRKISESNNYSEHLSLTLKEEISQYVKVPSENIHVNAGSEIIIRQLFSLYGKKVHLFHPTYYLFEQISNEKTITYLDEKRNFSFDLNDFSIPNETSLVAISNPNNPTGTMFNIKNNLEIFEKFPKTIFLIDEAFIEFGGMSAVQIPLFYDNVIVTRTFSKAFSLAGFRVGYVISNKKLTKFLNHNNDHYPISKPSEAAALASLRNFKKIQDRISNLKQITLELINSLQILGFKVYPTETHCFLVKIPFSDADEFELQLRKRGISIKVIKIHGLENKFVRITTSSNENNLIFLKTIREIISLEKHFQN